MTLKLVDAGTGEVLKVLKTPRTHVPQDYRICLNEWKGRELRLVLEDQNTDNSFAWIGLVQASLSY